MSSLSARNRPSSSIAISATVTLSLSLRVADEVLAAVGAPDHRAMEPARDVEQQRIFAVDEELRAEAAADVADHDPQLLDRHLHNKAGDDLLDTVSALASEPKREAIGGGVVFGDGGARLHVIGDQALVHDFHPRHMGGFVEDRVGSRPVADLGVIGDIAGRAGINLSSAG